jgi:AraC-like DNA-binding protein
VSAIVRFRAGDEPAASRRDYWQHVVSAAIGPVELEISGALDRRDQLVVGSVGAVRVGALTAGKSSGASRTRRHIRSSDPDVCKIDVVAGGSGVIEQDGRQARLRDGDLTFVDLSRPAYWRMSAQRVVAVVFPRSLLPLHPDELARLTAVGIPGDRGTGALVSSLARQLVGHVDDCGGTEAARLGTAVLDLLAVALAARLDRGSALPPDTRQRALLLRIQAAIEQRLGDPELSPGSIAAGHHISVRYLHKLFETQHTTVGGWIRRRRLERCRRDLLDPAQRDRPVSAIGARWGITNAAHFTRLFRAAYGAPPAEYRMIGTGLTRTTGAGPALSVVRRAP